MHRYRKEDFRRLPVEKLVHRNRGRQVEDGERPFLTPGPIESYEEGICPAHRFPVPVPTLWSKEDHGGRRFFPNQAGLQDEGLILGVDMFLVSFNGDRAVIFKRIAIGAENRTEDETSALLDEADAFLFGGHVLDLEAAPVPAAVGDRPDVVGGLARAPVGDDI